MKSLCILLLLCALEACTWVAAASSDQAELGNQRQEYILRENKNLKSAVLSPDLSPSSNSESYLKATESEIRSVEARSKETVSISSDSKVAAAIPIMHFQQEFAHHESDSSSSSSSSSFLLSPSSSALWLSSLSLFSVIAVVALLRSSLLSKSVGPLPFAHLDKKKADIIIVGSGVVGSALAHALGNQGRKVLLFERDFSKPNRIVGELMQPGGVEQVKKLGLSHCFEGIDSPVTNGYAVFSKGQEVLLNYPFINLWDEKAKRPSSVKSLPHGRSFHHGSFVMNLRNAASSAPNVTCCEANVTNLIEEDGRIVGVKYLKDENKNEAYAPLVVVCDGVHSRFRKDIVSEKPIATSSFFGYVLDDCNLPYPDRGHVILGHPSPILAYPISSKEVRILVDVPHPLPDTSNGDLQKYFSEIIAPQLPESIRYPFLKAVEEKTARSMPCSRLHPEVYKKPGVVMIGDAWNMRHPLTGGGMTVGLSDAVLLTDILSNIKNINDQGELVDSFSRNFYYRRITVASSINILAQALYGVFSATCDPAMPLMRDACFAYFELGGVFASGPMSLLAGTCTSNLALVGHFFMVAFFGMYRVLLSPIKKKLIRMVQLLKAATSLITPLLTKEHVISLRYPLW